MLWEGASLSFKFSTVNGILDPLIYFLKQTILSTSTLKHLFKLVLSKI